MCSNCIGNIHLKEYITINGENNKCSYCINQEHECVTVPTNILSEEIIKRIEIKYIKANIYALKDDEDYYSTIVDTKEIIEKEIKPANNQLLNELYNLAGSCYWADKYSYIKSPDEEIGIRWEIFCKDIKDEICNEAKNKILKETLAPICQYIVNNGIIDIIDVGSRFYRARAKALEWKKVSHEELGPPPKEYTKSNRFTRAEEPAFYGSTDDVTPILEVCTEPSAVTVGVFVNTIPLTIINLDKIAKEIKQERSVFEDNYYIKEFLDYFAIKIAKPVDEENPKSYVPTQEMLHFFRKELEKEYGIKINGLLYPISKTKRNTTNCILFFNSNDCTDDEKNEDKPLKLIKKEVWVYSSGYWPIKDKSYIEFSFGTNK